MILLLLLAGAMSGPPAPCPIERCLAEISSRTPVSRMALSEQILIGQWSFDGGLGGWDLHLFHDHTYAYSLWSDLPPTLLIDMGRWRISDGVLLFTPDTSAGNAWRMWRDRRFVGLRAGGKGDLRLFGLDSTLAGFMEMVDSKQVVGSGAFSVSSLKKTRTWSPAEGAGIMAEVRKLQRAR